MTLTGLYYACAEARTTAVWLGDGSVEERRHDA